MLVGGDEVQIDSPGGGGYGNPLEHDRVARDVFEGFITPEQARALYGWDEAGS